LFVHVCSPEQEAEPGGGSPPCCPSHITAVSERMLIRKMAEGLLYEVKMMPWYRDTRLIASGCLRRWRGGFLRPRVIPPVLRALFSAYAALGK